MTLFTLELTNVIFLSVSLRSDSPQSDLLCFFPNSLASPQYLVNFNHQSFNHYSFNDNYTGFRSQLVSHSKFLFWFLNPNWVLLQNILWITFTPLYLRLHSVL